MKETTLFLLTQIDQEVGIIDSITSDAVVEECINKISHLTEMIREAIG